MDKSDVIYKAIADYRKNTEGHEELSRFRDAVAADHADDDLLEVTKNVCEIDEEWIDEIEKGLVFVAAALAEERQFIQSNGEIIPIEKVKRVSKDSVEHLAKHSNLLTKKPTEGNDLIPDKLYTVERLSDYTVYENKFLYMLLAYLRDFITYRYEKIIDLTYTYAGKLELKKDFAYHHRKTKFSLTLEEERKKDKYLKELNPIKSTIGRIEKILSDVNFYLTLPIMQEVAKAPIIKPPFTKTNVLRMNKHFKGAVALYEYVNSYTKQGYNVVPQKTSLSPLPPDTADAFAELLVYSSFLTYEHNLNLGDVFKKHYEAELQRLKNEEEKRLYERLKNLRKRVKESGKGMEEYMLALEERVKVFDVMQRDLETAHKDIQTLTEEKGMLIAAVEERNKTIADARAEINALTDKNIEEIQRLRAEHMSALADKDKELAAELDKAQQQHDKVLATIRDERMKERAEVADKIEKANADAAAKIAEAAKLNAEKNQKAESAAAERIRAAESSRAEMAEQARSAEERMAKLSQEYMSVKSRLNALRAQYGLIGDDEDYTSAESFDDIEKQYKAFTAFYKSEWKKSKKRIRRETLTMEGVKDEAKRKTKKQSAEQTEQYADVADGNENGGSDRES